MAEQKFLTNLDVAGTVDLSNLTIDSTQGTDGQVLTSTGAGVAWEDAQGGTSETAERIEVTVKNVSGGSLSKGTVVHTAPSANPPNGNLIEVIAADYDDITKMPAIGILNETIANEAEGSAVMMGALSGINTSSFSIGDELYVGNLGTLTNSKPTTAGQLIQKIAVVIKSHASNGLIKIFGAGRSNDVPLPLYIDNTNQRVGIGDPTPSYTLDVNGTIYGSAVRSGRYYGTSGTSSYLDLDSGAPYSLLASSEVSISNSITCNDLTATETDGISASNGPVYANRFHGNGNTTYFVDPNNSTTSAILNGKVGIGTTGPSNGKLQIDSTGNQISIETGTSGDGRLHIGHFANGTFIGTYGDDGGAADIIRFGTHSGDEKMRIDSSGNVGIGVSPGYKLDVNGQGNFSDYLNVNSSTGIKSTGWVHLHRYGSSTNVAVGNNGTDVNLYVPNGKVGIGTTNPVDKFQIDAANSQLRLRDTDDGSYTQFSSSGNKLAIRQGSTSADHIWLTSTGDVGIGTSGPGYKLEVNGTAKADKFVSLVNASNSGLTRDWAIIGTGDRGAGLQVNDISGAKYAIYAGGYDLTFGKHVSSSNTYTAALGIYATGPTDSSPYVQATHSLRAPIFYDSTNPGYYVDPDSSSVAININGKIYQAKEDYDIDASHANAIYQATRSTQTDRGSWPGTYYYGVNFGDRTKGIQLAAPYSSANNLYFRSGTDNSGADNGANAWKNWKQLYHTDYHPEADKWTTARTITLAGDLSGSVSIDGSANVTLTATVNDDSHDLTWANIDGETANSVNGWGGLRHQTNDGYIDFGPANTSHAHIYTDRPNFYFNKELLVNNQQVFHTGNDGSGSGLDADFLDGVQGSSYIRNDVNNVVTTGKRVSFYSNDNIESGSGNEASLEVYQDTVGADAFMQFHVANDFAAYFGLDGSTNDFAVGGWSMGASKYKVWHAGNDDILFKKGTDIGGSVNLNNYTTDGYYHQNANANAASGSNYPAGGAGMLNVVSDGAMVYQTYHQYDGNAYYHRSYYNGTWYAWRKVWTNGNDGGGSGLDADTVDGIQGSSFLRSDADDTATGVITVNNDLYLGTYSGTTAARLFLNGTTANKQAKIHCTNGNLHIDSENGHSIYLNYYEGTTDNVIIGNGNGGLSGTILKSNGRVNVGEHLIAANNVYAGGSQGFVFGSSTSEGEYIARSGDTITFYSGGAIKFDITPSNGVHFRNGSVYYAQISNTGHGRFANDVVAFYNFSDKRLKTNIKPTTGNLDKILKLNPVEYNWKEGYRKDKKEIGLIAQEVEKIIPEVVRENERLNDDTLYKQVDYEHIVSTLIGAVQEQQKQIDELKSIINGSP